MPGDHRWSAASCLVLLLFSSISALPTSPVIEETDPSGEPLPVSGCDGKKTYKISVKYDWIPRVSTGAEEQRAGFAPLLCAAHSPDYTLWRVGVKPTPGIISLLRDLNFDTVLHELRDNQTASKPSVSNVGISPRASAFGNVVASPGRDSVTVTVDASINATLISCIAGIVPSPDWFVGFSAQEVCKSNAIGLFSFVNRGIQLRSYDAEFDDLESFRGARRPVANARVVRFRVGLGDSLGTAVIADPLNPVDDSQLLGKSVVTNNRGADAYCFPGSAIVQLADGTRIAMRDLRIRHRVLSSQWTQSEVFMFSHYHPEVWKLFVHLAFEDTRKNITGTLVASPGHYVYMLGIVNGSFRTDKRRLVAMDNIRTGDFLVGQDEYPRRVVRVSRRLDQGLYNPHTLDGDLVVNGVHVSCYTRAVAPVVAEKLLLPLRMIHTMGLSFVVQRFAKLLLSGRFNAVLSRVVPSGL